VESRFKALVEAGIAVSSELSLDAVLRRIVKTAADLTDARYAALGVIDATGRSLDPFITHGIDEETERRIGDRPHGRGILGLLIRDARPIRMANLNDHPAAAGFPPHHPPMTTFLGVPIKLRGVAYGNLYITEKREGEFTQEDEDIITLLAAQAAVAIENARLYESATRWSRQLESLTEIGTALAAEIDLGPLLQTIAERLRELISARQVLIALPRADVLRVEAAAGEFDVPPVGTDLSERSKSKRVLERRRSERVDALIDDPEADQSFARQIGARTGLYVPLVLRDRQLGIMIAHDKEGRDSRFSEEDLRLAETFAARAATAVDLSERVERDALRRVIQTQELERKRLARELHDETGQALTSVLLGLRALEEAKDETALRQAAANVRQLVVDTLHDVRRLAVELRPKALDDFGLLPALERLTQTFSEQTGISTQLEAAIGDARLPEEVETTLYRTVQEALTNVVKHARATRVSIVVTRKDGGVTALIEDDGIGMAESRTANGGIGLIGMQERVALVGGRLEVESSAGGGTTLAIEVPA
jgi:signal transduction histidine kinase